MVPPGRHCRPSLCSHVQQNCGLALMWLCLDNAQQRVVYLLSWKKSHVEAHGKFDEARQNKIALLLDER